jgi:hypothetical protein
MTYLSAKKIFPGNWAEPLNGWYKNIDTTDDGSNNASKGGPTSVLALPGYRYFQQRGYVPVTATSGAGAVAEASVIVPSPYRNDDTRPDITGMVISGDSTIPAYVYRATISVASGWGDGRVASGIYAATGNVLSFTRNNSGPVSASGDGEGVAQANLTSTVLWFPGWRNLLRWWFCCLQLQPLPDRYRCCWRWCIQRLQGNHCLHHPQGVRPWYHHWHQHFRWLVHLVR